MKNSAQTPMYPELFDVLDKRLRIIFDTAYRKAEKNDPPQAEWIRATADAANALMNLHRDFKPAPKP